MPSFLGVTGYEYTSVVGIDDMKTVCFFFSCVMPVKQQVEER